MSLLYRLKNAVFEKLQLPRLKREIVYEARKSFLTDRMLHSTAPGTTTARLCDHEVIVSLTTYGKRLYDVPLTIESIMQGSMLPNRIVLWLSKDLRNTPLPIALQRQQQRGLEVAFCEDIRSFKKLVPSLRKYPEAVIITIDDDSLYVYDLVEKLVKMHREHPEHVLGNWVNRIILGSSGRPEPPYKWVRQSEDVGATFLNMAVGVAGILYPPHSLDPEVTNEEVFMDICKYADDVWFYAMALKAGTKIQKSYTHDARGLDYIAISNEKETALSRTNNQKKGKMTLNDMQRVAVFDKYNLWSIYDKEQA